MSHAFSLSTTYVHLRPNDSALAMEGGEERLVLKARQTLVVPAGLWHRGIVRQPGELLFITAGAGTEHRRVAL